MATETQKQIEGLRKKRGQAKAAITRVDNFCATSLKEANNEDINIRLELLEGAYSEFKELDERLVMHSQPSEIDEQEGRYCRLKAQLKTESTKKNVMYQDLHQQFNETMRTFVQQQKDYFNNMHEKSFSVKDMCHDDIRLPKINIQPFSGSYADFPSFKDMYESSIHKNVNLSKIHKFKYLKGLLVGEAANLVKHIQITEINYSSTWEKIVQRYDHKDHIMSMLIKQFLDQPKLHGRSRDIRQMADKSDEIIRGITALGPEAETRDTWLIYLLIEKCDIETKTNWALESHNKSFPKLRDFIEFLNKRSDALEKAEPITNRKIEKPSITSANLTIDQSKSCPMCSGNHGLYKCAKFSNQDVTARRGFIAEKGLCFNCMGSRHLSVNCKFRTRCFKCNRRHHHLLHTDPNEAGEDKEQDEADWDVAKKGQNIKTLQMGSMNSYTILPTAIIRLKDVLGRTRLCRALLDSGSQASFIDSTLFKELNIPKKSARIAISGLATSNLVTEGLASIEFMPRQRDEIIQGNFLILKSLPLDVSTVNMTNIEEFGEIELADPNYNKAGKIDILIGADLIFSLLRDGRKSKASLTAQNTVLGYIISGGAHKTSTIVNLHIELNIDHLLRRFWEQEELCDESSNPNDHEIERHYVKHTQRDHDGRFVVRMPFNNIALELGNSSYAAKRRFYNLEKKLENNKELNHEYKKFMQEYLEMGHMYEVSKGEYDVDDNKSFYLPHHAVIKRDSLTTKVRVVFDGSCKTSTGVSINDTLLVGPTIQQSLWEILLRFRTHKFAISADIAKMYRQIKINENDKNYQRIFWRERSSDPLKIFKLQTVTYGTSSAPFLATRCLLELANENLVVYPEAANAIKNDFYVDDLLTGSNCIQGLSELKNQIVKILLGGGFQLRKWSSNVKEFSDLKDYVQIDDGALTIKVLGLHWYPEEDFFTFKSAGLNTNLITKRIMLSESSKLYDPLGWLAPSIILIKIQFQQLWLTKLNWDDPVPKNIQEEWIRIRHQFQQFENLRIQRRMILDRNVQLHAFADASERAYAAVIYCRSESTNGEVNVSLITSKTKVSPIKTVSLPRLELCAAVLASKLLKKVSDLLRYIPHTTHAWTDSQIVLAWLNDHPRRWKQYVGNRTAEILTICPREQWKHVKSKDNPADVASRGIIPAKLCKLNSWWHGPEWLSNASQATVTGNDPLPEQNEVMIQAEARRIVFHINAEDHFLTTLLEKCSSYSKLLRVVVYIQRWVHRLKSKNKRGRYKFVTAQELSVAEEFCVKWVQTRELGEEILMLQQLRELPRKNKLKSLNPFLDDKNILRVGGRLKNANVPYDAKHPIILPKKNILSQLIIRHIHKKYIHAGASLTFFLCRQRFWIIKCRSLVNKLVRECVTCVRYNGKPPQQIMGQLPKYRVQPVRPFTNTGLDFTGAISLLTRRGRGAKVLKGYIAVFVCLSIKAIHLEVVSDYTADAVIAALRRFSARRGLPARIYSDNGPNFVGADRKLREFTLQARKYTNDSQRLTTTIEFQEEIGSYLAKNSIEWHYIPPLTPHFGGIWESAVKIVKRHLEKATHGVNLTYEEMSTLLCNIEAIVNSRPLTVASSNDINFEVLSPAHFLIGSSLTSLPEPYDDRRGICLSKLWSAIQQRTLTFWRRFRVEYLNNMQQRHKWQECQRNIKIGDIVVLKEDYLPPCKWALGKIIDVYPGDDQQVRVVTVKTATSTFKRPLNKIVPIPVYQENH